MYQNQLPIPWNVIKYISISKWFLLIHKSNWICKLGVAVRGAGSWRRGLKPRAFLRWAERILAPGQRLKSSFSKNLKNGTKTKANFLWRRRAGGLGPHSKRFVTCYVNSCWCIDPPARHDTTFHSRCIYSHTPRRSQPTSGYFPKQFQQNWRCVLSKYDYF